MYDKTENQNSFKNQNMPNDINCKHKIVELTEEFMAMKFLYTAF